MQINLYLCTRLVALFLRVRPFHIVMITVEIRHTRAKRLDLDLYDLSRQVVKTCRRRRHSQNSSSPIAEKPQSELHHHVTP